MSYQLFNTGDIIRRKYVSIDLERYFLILDVLRTDIDGEPGHTEYMVLELGEEQTSFKYAIRPISNPEWPIDKVA